MNCQHTTGWTHFMSWNISLQCVNVLCFDAPQKSLGSRWVPGFDFNKNYSVWTLVILMSNAYSCWIPDSLSDSFIIIMNLVSVPLLGHCPSRAPGKLPGHDKCLVNSLFSAINFPKCVVYVIRGDSVPNISLVKFRKNYILYYYSGRVSVHRRILTTLSSLTLCKLT